MKPRRPKKRKDSAKKKMRKYTDRKRCRFCRQKVEVIDYKEVDLLSKFCSGQGKLSSRKRSGNCSQHQSKVKLAVKQARHLALLPFVG